MAPWGSSSDDLRGGILRVADLVAAHPVFASVLVLTNSQREPAPGPVAGTPPTYISRALKPWRTHGLRRHSAGPLAVIGDQLLTDGMLAWRCRRCPALFIEVADRSGAPWWPRAQGLLAGPLRRIAFSVWEHDR